VRASAGQNPDLFWGLRGGGGNFGVVTGIEYELHPVGPEIVGGVVAWPQARRPGCSNSTVRSPRQPPPNSPSSRSCARPHPPVAAQRGAWEADRGAARLLQRTAADGEKAVAPIKGFGHPVGDVLVRRPYTQMQSLLDATSPRAGATTGRASTCRVWSPLCDKVIEHAAKIPSPHSAVVLFQIDGALNAGTRSTRPSATVTHATC